MLAGTALCLEYVTYTSLAERNYDGPIHAAYVQYLSERGRLPELSSCQFCIHPPLYYALAALWSKLVLRSEWIPRELGLEWFSLLLFFGFVVFALLTVRRAAQNQLTRWLAALLIVFWPSSIIHSVRVHNDALASLLMMAAIYWLAEWDRDSRAGQLYAALGCTALALLTKASAYAMAATLLLFVCLRVRSKQEPTSTSLRRCAGVVLVLFLAGFLAVRLRYSGQGICQMALGRACYSRYVPPVPDSVARFVTFHPVDFLLRSDTVPDDPFLNRFLKSVLFGVAPLGEDFDAARYQLIAGFMSALLLAMLAVCVWGATQLRGDTLRKNRVYLAAPVILFLALVGFRVSAPNEFHEDFRHIFPALAPFCLAYAGTVVRLRRCSKLLFYGGVAVALALAASSLAFFVHSGARCLSRGAPLQQKAAISLDRLHPVKGNRASDLRVGPLVEELVPHRAETLQELSPVEQAIGTKGRADVLQRDDARPVIRGDAI